MRKDEPHLAVEGKKLLLSLHNEVVRAFIRLRCTARVLPMRLHIFLRLVRRKVAVMHESRVFRFTMKSLTQFFVLRLSDQITINLFKPARILPLMRSLIIVHTIIRHLVDEEQTEHLDALRIQETFLVEMFLDGRAYLLSFDLIRVNLPNRFI